MDNKNKEYNSIEILIKSDKSDVSDLLDFKEPSKDTVTTLVWQIKVENTNSLDKLCQPWVGCQLTKVLRHHKSTIAMKNKLEKVHANLWDLNNLPLQSRSTHAVILICEHIKKTWTLYLRGKNDFMDIFQTWLLRVKAESNSSIKVFQANKGKEFIFAKL